MNKTMTKTTETDLLAHILDCGYADVSFILDLFDSFDIEFDEIMHDYYDDANALIGEIFSCAISNAGLYDDEFDTDRISVFTNCLDSHLFIDGEKMYNKQDIENWKEQNLKSND